MLVSEILAIKGKVLFTIAPNRSIAEAVEIMNEQDVGSLVVFSRGAMVAITGTIDEDLAQHGMASGFGLDQHGVHPARRMHDHAHRQRVKQDLRATAQHQFVSGDLERRIVVSLGSDTVTEHPVRLVQAAERAHVRQQVIGHAMHDLLDAAEYVGMQAAEIGDACRGTHATEKSIGLDQQGPGTGACRAGGCSDAGGTASEHDDVKTAEDGCLAARFGNLLLHGLACIGQPPCRGMG